MRWSFHILTIFIITLAAVVLVTAQEKKVFVRHIEVNRKPVKASFKVQIITPDGKVFTARTDKEGFYIPAEVASLENTNVEVVISFKKYTLTFSSLRTSNFDVTWVVGVDTPPFDPEFLGDGTPEEVQHIYYLIFSGEPERLFVVPVNRISDD